MDSPRKLRYEIDLTRPVQTNTSPDVVVRTITTDDVNALASLMLDAYRGTIDYEDENLQDALGEVEAYFSSEPMIEHSYLATVDERIAAAVLIQPLHEKPFVRSVMTAPDHKKTGVGRLVVSTAVASLRRAGHSQLVLFITEGNVPSEALFASLGAAHVP
jgi:L-amino acid N-acyltransferase YncA